jgi:signal transduction histidine kinase
MGKHSIHIQGDKELEIYADEHRIDQVIVNLVNNAVKYAPDSKDIFITIEKEQDQVKIAVRDDGPGISEDKIPHLFDRYYRVHSTGYQGSGLGLGLYICAEIIKRHGGEIGVESELGKGSTFWFTLPLQQEPDIVKKEDQFEEKPI